MTDLDAEIAALKARLKELQAARTKIRDRERSAAYRANPRNALFRKLRRNGIPLDVARAEVARAFAMEAAE